MSWQTDYLRPGYSPAETAEARIDPDQNNEPDQDWADGWGER